MRLRRMCAIAGIFALFQGLMPLLGWICVHTVVSYFSFFEALIPWISLGLLGYIGGKMLYDSFAKKDSEEEKPAVGLKGLLVQGVATSIDALSVGFTISDYNAAQAIVCALLIALVTFAICYAGIILGKKFGTTLAGKSAIFGGAILIFIGLEIFITSFI
jgi:putative Mn2+ efflux pump MntP